MPEQSGEACKSILVKVIETRIPDAKIIEPRVFGDERGFFLETFRDDWFKENVADVNLFKTTTVNLAKVSYVVCISS
jgi:dTDP-4-dehydrorhamnose 3,5-epimerase-like enzyme